jgi:hypothetical protein
MTRTKSRAENALVALHSIYESPAHRLMTGTQPNVPVRDTIDVLQAVMHDDPIDTLSIVLPRLIPNIVLNRREV